MSSYLSLLRPLIPSPLNVRLPSTPVYGVAMTCVLSCVILLVFFTIQIVGVAIFASYVLPASQATNWQIMLLMGNQNGTVMGLMVTMVFVVIISTVAIIIKLKKGACVQDYLALYGFTGSQFWRGVGLLFLLNIVIQVVSVWLDLKPMDFLDTMYATAHPLWLLVLAMVVLAPIYEEVMFRGFMWVGLAKSRLGFWGATFITSAIFAAIHTQYTSVELIAIVALAFLFSYTRARSGSLLLPMVLHIFNNALAMGLYMLGE